MAWARDAQRLAEDGYMVVVFLDELTTVPPTTQAAMLRLLTENVCGELQLPDYEPGKGGVVYLCASNAVEWAAGGQEIQPPMANRLWHGEFPMDHETWCDMMVSDFPGAQRPAGPARRLPAHASSSAARDDRGVREGGGARCLDGAARRSGAAQRSVAVGPHLVSGVAAARRHRSGVAGQSRCSRARRSPASSAIRRCRSSSTARALNLPDPEDILKDPRSFVLPDRVDRAYAICYSLAGAVLNNKTPERWEAAMIALGVAAQKNADIPTAAARTLCDKRNRPEGATQAADECRPFYELMQMAKLRAESDDVMSQARRSDSRLAIGRRTATRARCRRRACARRISALLRAGALQPDPGRDRSDRQHGGGCALAALLQRRLAGDAHASKRTRRC